MTLENELMIILKDIPDPRHKRGIRYRFEDLLLMIIYAALSGYTEGADISYYVELHFKYFKELLGISSVPSHDTFTRIIRMVDFNELSKGLSKWLQMCFPEIYSKYDGYKVLHIDGKAVRAAAKKSEGQSPVYLLNSMYEGETISLYTQKIGDKENEITAIPKYLDIFNLKDTIVTIDAIGCNNEIIKKIHSKGGKFILPVKDNNAKLKKTITDKITELETSGEFKELDSSERLIKEHGRIEHICAHMIKDTTFIYEKLGFDRFYGEIARIGVIDKTNLEMVNGEEKTTITRAIMITDLETISVENLLKIKLSHWSIESEHWRLDVQLDEDRMTASIGNAVENGSIFRRFCLAARKYDPELSKKPMGRFLMRNACDIQKIEKLLFGNIAKETIES